MPSPTPIADELVKALGELSFEFENYVEPDGRHRTMGFAPEAVIEIVDYPRKTISLLFSDTDQTEAAAWSAVCLATVAESVGVDFTVWLAQQLKSWRSSSGRKRCRQFGRMRVTVESMQGPAAFLTLEST